MQNVRLKSAIDLGGSTDGVERGEDGLPSAFRLLKFGTNQSKKGPIKLDEKGAAEVMRRYTEHGIKLAIDWEHQTFSTLENGKPAPALGWIVPEVRADGLWAIVDQWTDNGAEMLRSKAYRYFSPVVTLDKNQRVVGLAPIALTNHPALSGLPSLSLRHKDENMDEEQIAKLRVADAFAGEVLKLTSTDDHQAAIGTIATWQASHQRVDELTAELAARDVLEREQLLKQLYDTGKLPKEGKKRAYAESRTLKELREYAETLEPIIPVSEKPIAQETAPVKLTADARLAAAEQAIDAEIKAEPGVSPAIAMMRAATKNPALFEGNTNGGA